MDLWLFCVESICEMDRKHIQIPQIPSSNQAMGEHKKWDQIDGKLNVATKMKIDIQNEVRKAVHPKWHTTYSNEGHANRLQQGHRGNGIRKIIPFPRVDFFFFGGIIVNDKKYRAILIYDEHTQSISLSLSLDNYKGQFAHKDSLLTTQSDRIITNALAQYDQITMQ